MFRNRVRKELDLLVRDPCPGISVWLCGAGDNLAAIEASIEGPVDSPYEEGVFQLSVRIPQRYPIEPPIVQFTTPIFHPNIDSDGRICLDTLKSQPAGTWSPASSLHTVLLSIRLLMGHPNGTDGLTPAATELYLKNIMQFRAVAREHTRKHASPRAALIADTAGVATESSAPSGPGAGTGGQTGRVKETPAPRPTNSTAMAMQHQPSEGAASSSSSSSSATSSIGRAGAGAGAGAGGAGADAETEAAVEEAGSSRKRVREVSAPSAASDSEEDRGRRSGGVRDSLSTTGRGGDGKALVVAEGGAAQEDEAAGNEPSTCIHTSPGTGIGRWDNLTSRVALAAAGAIVPVKILPTDVPLDAEALRGAR